MKKILMLLAFVVVSAMGKTNHEVEKNLSQQERFEMLFGNTAAQFNEVRQTRAIRTIRHNRTIESNRVLSKDKIIEISTLTENEKYELLFGNTMLTKRVARTARLIFRRQARHSLYVGLNF